MEILVSIKVPFDLAVTDTVVVVLYGIHWSKRVLSSLTGEDEACSAGDSVFLDFVETMVVVSI